MYLKFGFVLALVHNLPSTRISVPATHREPISTVMKMHVTTSEFPTARSALPLVVSPSKAMVMLDCGRTRLYELLNTKELESYRDGKSRKITVSSIQARIRRMLQQNHGT